MKKLITFLFLGALAGAGLYLYNNKQKGGSKTTLPPASNTPPVRPVTTVQNQINSKTFLPPSGYSTKTTIAGPEEYVNILNYSYNDIKNLTYRKKLIALNKIGAATDIETETAIKNAKPEIIDSTNVNYIENKVSLAKLEAIIRGRNNDPAIVSQLQGNTKYNWNPSLI